SGGSSKRMQEAPAQWSHQRQRREPNQPHDQIERSVDERTRSYLLRRAVEDPEKNDAHLIEPQQARQIRLQILRDANVRSAERRFELGDALVAHRLGLVSERRERMIRIESDARQPDQEAAMP